MARIKRSLFTLLLGTVMTLTTCHTVASSKMADTTVISGGVTWNRVFIENFTSGTKPAVWQPYDAGSGDGKYDDPKNTSYVNGVMRIRIRNVNGVMSGTAGQFGDSHTSLRTVIKFRCPIAFSGAGMANMIWPDGDIWSNGEEDFPEAQFDSTIQGYVHELGTHPENNALAVDTQVSACGSGWHTAVSEWLPGRYVRYIFDGTEIGRNTTQVPTTSHSWRFQAADNGGLRSSGGIVDIDSIAEYTANDSALASR